MKNIFLAMIVTFMATAAFAANPNSTTNGAVGINATPVWWWRADKPVKKYDTRFQKWVKERYVAPSTKIDWMQFSKDVNRHSDYCVAQVLRNSPNTKILQIKDRTGTLVEVVITSASIGKDEAMKIAEYC